MTKTANSKIAGDNNSRLGSASLSAMSGSSRVVQQAAHQNAFRKCSPIPPSSKSSSTAKSNCPPTSTPKAYLSRSQDNLACIQPSSRYRGKQSSKDSDACVGSLQKAGSGNLLDGAGDASRISKESKLLKIPAGVLRGAASMVSKSASSNCIESSCSGPCAHLSSSSASASVNKENQPKLPVTGVSLRRNVGNDKNHADVRITKTKSTVTELQKQKQALEVQVSDLVKNAELKQAEMATLHFEVNRLKEDHSLELERLRKESDALKQKLRELGICDSHKEAILRQAAEQGQCLSVDTAEANPANLIDAATSPIKHSASAVNEFADQSSDDRNSCNILGTSPTGATAGRSLADWDRQSVSSLSEVSLACLQDRIVQMEETHYCTNEELQATLQELTDLQDMVNDLTTENEQLNQERGVLVESLCTQTAKVENDRLQIENLKHLLLSGNDFLRSNRFSTSALGRSDREQQLVELLKTTHQEHEELMCKYLEVRNVLRASEEENSERQEMFVVLRDRAKLLDDQIEEMSNERSILENQILELRQYAEKDKLEVCRLQSLLEKERSRVEELQHCSEATNRGDVEKLLDRVRAEKDQLHESLIHLKESLAQKSSEAARLRQVINNLEEDLRSSHNSVGKTVEAYEGRIQQLEKENDAVKKMSLELRTSLLELEERCKRYVEDKKELKANILQLQKAIDDLVTQRDGLRKEFSELQHLRESEVAEWRQFQADLQLAVVVANDFKMESQSEVEHLTDENAQLKDRLVAVQAELDKMRSSQQRAVAQTPPRQNMVSFRTPISSIYAPTSPDVKSRVEGYMCSVERNGSALSSAVRGATKSGAGVSGAGQSSNTMSVRALIESLEGCASDGLSASTANSNHNAASASCRQHLTGAGNAASLMRSPGSAHRSPINLGMNGCSPLTPINESLACSKSATHLSTLPLAVSCRKNSDAASDLKISHKAANVGEPENAQQTLSGILRPSPQRGLNGQELPILRTDDNNNNSASGTAEAMRPKGILINKSIATQAARKSVLDVDSKDPLGKLMKDAGRGSRRNALLKWCQNKTLGYTNVEITNFSSSWNDGLAFCALLHTYIPDKIPFHALDAKDKRRNFSVAFEAAENIGIPKLLSLDEMVSLERPDWQLIINYVTAIYKHFES